MPRSAKVLHPGDKLAASMLDIMPWAGAAGKTVFCLTQACASDTKAAMAVFQRTIEVPTRGAGLKDVSSLVQHVVTESGIAIGLCTVFVQHTSASLVIQENADAAVMRDLGRWMDELAPTTRVWEHSAEGPDDMPAHARAAVTRTSETIPVAGGRLALGTWQALYLWEHRARAHTRKLIVHVAGE